MGKDWDSFPKGNRGACRKTGNGNPCESHGFARDVHWQYGESARDQFIAFLTPRLAECLRVARPGARMLCWAIPRTSHWTGTAIEESGWEITDVITHLTGQGFPKNHNISKTLESQGKTCQCRRHGDEYPPTQEVNRHADAAIHSDAQGVRVLRSGVDAEERDPGAEESDVFSGVCPESDRFEVAASATGTDTLPVLRDGTSEEATIAGANLLLDAVRGARQAGRTAPQDLRAMREGMASEERGSSPEESGLLAGMCRGDDLGREEREVQDSSGQVSVVRCGVPAEVQHSNGQGQALLGQVQRPTSGRRSRISGSPRDDRCQRPQGMDGSRSGELSGQDDRLPQSRMEGRSDLQAGQGELHRAEVCSMSDRPDADGPRRRLRDGASACDGPEGRAHPRKGRSRPSRRSSDPEQRPEQLGTLAGQREPQGDGAWPHCDRCGKPIVPDGIGTALKPSVEFWFLARKPLDGTYAENVLKHGTGGLQIDACRVAGAPPSVPQPSFNSPTGRVYGMQTGEGRNGEMSHAAGRWPANVVLSHSAGCRRVGVKRVKSDGHHPKRNGQSNTFLGLHRREQAERYMADPDGLETVAAWECVDGCPVAELDRQSGVSHTPSKVTRGANRTGNSGLLSLGRQEDVPCFGDSGGASRFFATFGYFSKASRTDRGEGNTHPTVKNTDLMKWLCRLICPPGGTILDPFMGSGSTGKAAVVEGFDFIGIEANPEYFAIAERRIAAARDAQPLFANASP